MILVLATIGSVVFFGFLAYATYQSALFLAELLVVYARWRSMTRWRGRLDGFLDLGTMNRLRDVAEFKRHLRYFRLRK